MRISAKHLVSAALVVIFFTGMQGGKYILANRLQELGILFSLIVFSYSAFLATLNVKDKDLRWNWWVFCTLAIVGYKFIVPGYVFSQNYGEPMLPSIAASREILIVFFGAGIYFLYRLGFEVELIEKLFVGTLVGLIINYLFHYYRMDLPSALNSPDHNVSALVVYDPWRGYRLVPTTVAMFLLAVYAPMRIFERRSTKDVLIWLVIIAMAIHALLLFKGRAASAVIIMSSLMYVFFFLRKRYIGLFFLSLPVIIAGFSFIVISMPGHLAEGDAGEQVRLESMKTAVKAIGDYPFLGYGQSSNYSRTEQDIFGPYFFSSDIGVLGTTAKYGLIGIAIYLFFSFFVIQRSVRTVWMYQKTYGKTQKLLIAICILHLSMLMNIILNPKLVFVDGMTLTAFLIGYTGALRHKIRKDQLNRQINSPSPQASAVKPAANHPL